MRIPRILPFVLAPALIGCAALAYYTQAVYGHLKLISAREPIDQVLADPALTPDLREKLQTVRRIRVFASEHLALPDNESYRYFTRLDHDYVVWNVVATPEFSLDPLLSCFPVAGCVAYKGYFNREDAAEFARQRRAEGYDVALSGATAYSTLGWFADPVLSSMLDYPAPELAGLIFHELAHQRVYVKGDSAFNEAFASFVENRGVASWLRQHGTPEMRRAYESRNQRGKQFTALLLDAREELQELFEKHRGMGEAVLREAKQSVFQRLRARYRELSKNWGDAFDAWVGQDLNNAHLALIATYHGGVPSFEALFEKVNGNWEAFYQAVEAVAEQSAEARAAWLQREQGSTEHVDSTNGKRDCA